MHGGAGAWSVPAVTSIEPAAQPRVIEKPAHVNREFGRAEETLEFTDDVIEFVPSVATREDLAGTWIEPHHASWIEEHVPVLGRFPLQTV